jgi:hypothetical protein
LARVGVQVAADASPAGMLHVAAAAAVAVGGAAAHAAWVRDKRARGPKGRQLQFVPGSADEALASQLATGDVVRYSRDCSLYPLLDGVTCLARKATSRYDHWGVIVHVAGVPHVWERLPAGGHALRPYDARLQASLARTVHVLPLAVPLTPDAAAAVTTEAKRRVAADPAVTAADAWSPAAVARHAAWTEVPAAAAAQLALLVRTEVAPRGHADDGALDRRNASLAAVRDLLRSAPPQAIHLTRAELLAPVRSSVARIARTSAPAAAPAEPSPPLPAAAVRPGGAAPSPAPPPSALGRPVLVRDLTQGQEG